jgi:hypothetical protein
MSTDSVIALLATERAVIMAEIANEKRFETSG